MRKNDMRLFALLAGIVIMIAIGVYIIRSNYFDMKCTTSEVGYKVLEPQLVYDYNTTWGDVYTQVLDKIAINVPTNRPNYISYDLCSPCRYNVTFISDKPTNFFVFDQYDKDRYFEGLSAFPIASKTSGKNTTLNFELASKGKYYFVFDRSAQGTTTNDPATGRIIINELRGVNQTVQVTKYAEVIERRNVTVCE
jgi:hypothetical protein